MIHQILLSCILMFSQPAHQKDYASFVLHNETLTSIPLSIPGVMNPNLTPLGYSGVSLALGQEVFFMEKKKKYLLLTVDASLEGDTLEVGQLIKTRKQELKNQQ